MQADIIKTILGYLPIAAPEMFKKWKVVIISVRQEYKSTKERIKTKLADILFKVFNTDGTKNREVTRFMPLEVKINRHKEQINTVVIDLNDMGMFLEHN